ncbi:MAG: zinc ribbon domain-containing protein [Oscillibacter sp.]|nr:zinc ribbon domain-containing protein [Oscillibacter sp.]
MAFLKDLGQKAKEVAAVAADKAKDVAAIAADKAKDAAEQTKLSMAIAEEQRGIEKNYRMIGEWFANEFEGELPESVKELVDAVNAAKEKIAELEAKKVALKADDGRKEPEAEPAPTVKACPVCGEPSDSRFCPKCGAPME